MVHCKPSIQMALLLTGNEILAGDIIDTNSAFMAKELRAVGIGIDLKLTVGDQMEAIINAINQLSISYDFVIANGGLGATVDDLTAEAVSTITGRVLAENPEAVDNIKRRYGKSFATASTDYFQHLRKQALLPEGVDTIPNPVGLALGFKIKIKRAVFYFTPGVPQEMKAMVKASIVPDILTHLPKPPTLTTKKITIVGAGESRIQQLINQKIPKETWDHIELGFRASTATVEVKLTITDETWADLQADTETRINALFSHQIAGHGESLAEIIVRQLATQQSRLALVENSSAGRITSILNEVPSASAVFSAGIVYRNQETLKHLIPEYGSAAQAEGFMSPKTIEELATRVRTRLGADCVLLTGPSEIITLPDMRRPAQKLMICCQDKQNSIQREFVIARDQEDFVIFVSIVALDMLRRFLSKLPNNAPYYFDELTRSQLK